MPDEEEKKEEDVPAKSSIQPLETTKAEYIVPDMHELDQLLASNYSIKHGKVHKRKSYL